MGPTAVYDMTLPRFSHRCAAVLSKAVRMWAKVSILGVKICTFVRRTSIFRLLIIASPLGFMSNTIMACISA